MLRCASFEQNHTCCRWSALVCSLCAVLLCQVFDKDGDGLISAAEVGTSSGQSWRHCSIL